MKGAKGDLGDPGVPGEPVSKTEIHEQSLQDLEIHIC